MTRPKPVDIGFAGSMYKTMNQNRYCRGGFLPSSTFWAMELYRASLIFTFFEHNGTDSKIGFREGQDPPLRLWGNRIAT